MDKKKIVIVGGVAGGASAAARLRRNDEHAEIVVLERGGYISFANCGMPYYIGNVIPQRGSLLLQTPRSMKERFNLDVRVRHEVLSIDRAHKSVRVRELETGEEYDESYDKLVLATGASPMKPPVKGMDHPKVFTVWSVPDTDRIKAQIEESGARRAVVIGGGFVGIEMAENLREYGLEVTLVEMLGQVMSFVDFDMAQIVHASLAAHRVALRLGKAVEAIEEEAAGLSVRISGGETLPADLVIVAAGVRPNSTLAREAGLETGKKGHVLTDAQLRTSDPDIYAVGDVIEVEDFVTKQKTAVPLAGPANKQGRIAADNIAGGASVYSGAQGTSVAKLFELTVAATGLNEKKLLDLGKKPYADYYAIYGHLAAHASYYPGSKPLHLKLFFDAQDGKVLGAQAVGEEGAAKRIDVIATAMRFGATVYDLTELELAYAPPYNTAKDPVNFMGYIAENILRGKVQTIGWQEIEHLDLASYQLVDCRTPAEFSQGAIPGSVNVPLNELRDRLGEIDRDKNVVIYCKAGLRSYIGARILLQNGFERVRSLTGGWTTYDFAHFEV